MFKSKDQEYIPPEPLVCSCGYDDFITLNKVFTYGFRRTAELGESLLKCANCGKMYDCFGEEIEVGEK